KKTQLENYEAFAEPIREKLKEMNYEFTMTSRIKSVYSVYRKMTDKGIPFEDVYDLLAVRIIFTPHEGLSEKDQCWRIYSAITEIYRPHPERIRDWISTPKANGYEALHITVMAPNGQWIEVQIRTERMHDIAERGLAAHWRYKTGERGENELDKWLRTIKEILENPEPNAIEFLDTFKLNLFAHEVFVFTPGGDIKTMPQGSTALDLAFQLHSQIGEHCIGAKINHELQPMSYVLKGGDQVEILTSSSQHPQAEWLNIVTTAKAQTCLRQYFRREERALTRKGERLFNDALMMYNATDAHDTALQRTMNYYHLTQPSELYLGIGKGTILLDNLQQVAFPKSQRSLWKRLNPFSSSEEKEVVSGDGPAVSSEPKAESSKRVKKIVLTDDGLGKDYVLSECCHPIPGDEVLGYVDEKGLVHIHMIECPEALKLKSSHGKQLCSATWNTHRVQSFVERIEIRGIDKFGVLSKLIAVISTEFHINLREIHITSEDGIFRGELEIYVYDRRELKDLFTALTKMPEIVSAKKMKVES
ncbi:MAG: bifunctional (p)ppGpp synthetase/guanosine-3',5'-bis(diphosphate) 3'-pyrophosphohydrolase, partial [Paludibacteraceae bacterium]|nr:bifunctional (p)ppGpp synthetase/guanosine-3',5'-bis(diphosphate) 3'-pyrophosphohydrolase [Paludibacteraceae bacterium]